MAKSTNPKGAGRRLLPEKKERTTLIVNPETILKIKYISFMEGKNQTDIIEEALSLRISAWEKENGKIPTPKK